MDCNENIYILFVIRFNFSQKMCICIHVLLNLIVASDVHGPSTESTILSASSNVGFRFAVRGSLLSDVDDCSSTGGGGGGRSSSS